MRRCKELTTARPTSLVDDQRACHERMHAATERVLSRRGRGKAQVGGARTRAWRRELQLADVESDVVGYGLVITGTPLATTTEFGEKEKLVA